MPPLTRSQLAGYAALAVFVLVVGGRWLSSRSAREAGGGGPPPARAAAAEPAPARVQVSQAARQALVHVAGAVRRPGVYRLEAGGRVQDAIRCAGGATRKADLDAINLAAPVQDGVQIVVPRRTAATAAVGEAAAGAPPASDAAAAGGAGAVAGSAPAAPVNLNTATAEQLETLDGVGPATAAKILDYRRQHGGFRSVEDLTQISGIGPKKLAALRGKVTT